MKKPKRILLFITDQQRYDTFSGLLHPIIKTPNFDRLMNEGATFTRAYSHCPICVPSRSNLWTGLPAHITGCIGNVNPIPLGTICLAEYFTDLNWYTCSVGRLHFSPTRNPHGFQRMYMSDDIKGNVLSDYAEYEINEGIMNVEHKSEQKPEHMQDNYLTANERPFSDKHNRTTWTTDKAIEEIRKNKDFPMFMNIGYIRPHPRFGACQGWYDMYKPEDMILPKWSKEDFGQVPKAQVELRNVKKATKVMTEYLDEDILRKNMAVYYGDISHIDYNLGRLIEFLKAEDLFDDTLLICTSDHGEMLGNHRTYLKMSMYEESSRVPLILSWPNGIKGGVVIDEVVSLQDIFTTCMELMDHPWKDKYESYKHVNLLDMIDGNIPENNRVFIETKGGCKLGVGIVEKSYKYAFYIYNDDTFDEILFDLESDPKEFNNLAKDESTLYLRKEYRKAIVNYLDDKATKLNSVNKYLEIIKKEI